MRMQKVYLKLKDDTIDCSYNRNLYYLLEIVARKFGFVNVDDSIQEGLVKHFIVYYTNDYFENKNVSKKQIDKLLNRKSHKYTMNAVDIVTTILILITSEEHEFLNMQYIEIMKNEMEIIKQKNGTNTETLLKYALGDFIDFIYYNHKASNYRKYRMQAEYLCTQVKHFKESVGNELTPYTLVKKVIEGDERVLNEKLKKITKK